MKRITVAVLTLVSFSGLLAFTYSSATACTPHPDNPDGCNNWPPKRVKIEDIKLRKPIPRPDPVCTSCPTNLGLTDQIIQTQEILVPQNGLQRHSVNQALPRKLHSLPSTR